MTREEATHTAIRWVTAANEGRTTSIDDMFAEVAKVRDRLLVVATGKGDGVERDRFGMTRDEVAAAVDACGPLPDPPVHPGGDEGLNAAARQAFTVGRDRIVCLECGREVVVLKQHLELTHSMKPTVYIARWGLVDDYPFVPTGYRERKSETARRQGLGSKVGYGARPANRPLVLPPTDLPIKRPRGRPRKNPPAGS